MLARLRIALEAVKIEHTLFALPFACLGLVLAEGGWPRPDKFLWVTLAMAGLRTAAMLFNRIFDAEIDAQNSRTQARAIPRGLLKKQTAWAVAFLSALLYLFAAYRLNFLCFKLATLPLVISLVYPLLKRWTTLCHFGVGIVLAGAPLGGWLAARGSWSGAPFWIAAAVLFWVTGFDLIYALLDAEFDQRTGIFSIPAKWGVQGALALAGVFHALMVVCLISYGFGAVSGGVYYTGVLVIALFLLREHALVWREGLAKVNEAFFTLNAWVSVAMFLFTFADLLVRV